MMLVFSPRTAFSETLRLDQVLLNIAVTNFLPNQSANRTSWNTNGDAAAGVVMTTSTNIACAI